MKHLFLGLVVPAVAIALLLVAEVGQLVLLLLLLPFQGLLALGATLHSTMSLASQQLAYMLKCVKLRMMGVFMIRRLRISKLGVSLWISSASVEKSTA